MEYKYCNKCRKPTHRYRESNFSWLLFIILTFFTGIGGIAYLIVWSLFSSEKCVECASSKK